MSNPMLSIAHLSILGCAILIFLSLAYKKNKRQYLLKSEFEDLEGRLNIAHQQLLVEELKNEALGFKLKRYDALAGLIDKLNLNLPLNDTLDTLIKESYAMLELADLTGIVYLSDAATNTLSLVRVKSGYDDALIKEKHGDIFDQWVLKHTQALLVEDTSSDFRFDFEKFKKTSSRAVGSVIAVCLVSENRPIGIMRFDSPRAKVFNLEDLRLLATMSDIAGVAVDNAQYYQRTRELAIKDGLTGLYTRKFIVEKLEQELKRCASGGGFLSIMILDIDFFKKYNDSHGHLAGDAVLKNLSAALSDYFKKQSAAVGRFGGEEFLIILPSAAKQEAFLEAENVRSLIQEKIVMIRRKPTAITVSIGVACFPQDAQRADDLLDKADSVLYEAKRTGRNRVCLY
jgi:diguanylate cyclase (GGDEF)-like protein